MKLKLTLRSRFPVFLGMAFGRDSRKRLMARMHWRKQRRSVAMAIDTALDPRSEYGFPIAANSIVPIATEGNFSPLIKQD